jgi:hypothetical protein
MHENERQGTTSPGLLVPNQRVRFLLMDGGCRDWIIKGFARAALTA